MTVLKLDHVTKRHPGSPPVTALRDISLTVAEGEFVALLGPSGSGKSTLLAVAGTLEHPTCGQVRIAGQQVSSMTDRQLSAFRAARIGFVFQQFFLLPALTALDNVATGLLYRAVPARGRREAAMAALHAVGLGDRITHRPGQLSGGECQRVAIARALAGKPAIILADEPTGNLDTAAGTGILTLLRDLATAGTTIILVTHNPDLGAAASRTIRLRDGAIEHDTKNAEATA